jgi:hypothetical protein
MKKTLILAMLGLIIAGFTLACCNPERMAERLGERMLEEALEEEGGDVDIDVGEDVTVPADMPKELVYAGAKATSTLTVQREGKQVTNVTFETKSSVTRVTTYYKGLSNKGWEMAMVASGTEGGEFILKKGDMGAVVTVGGEDGTTSILVVYGEDLNE